MYTYKDLQRVGIWYRVFIKYCLFFPKILKYSGLWPFPIFPLYQCVYTHQAGRTPALQQNWQSSEKSQNFKEKTQYLMNSLYKNYVLLLFQQLMNIKGLISSASLLFLVELQYV